MSEDSVGGHEDLAQAKQTIAEQKREIERLRRRLDDERLAEELRDALVLAATTGAIAAPSQHSRLLELIVETAARVIPSEAASLFLIDAQAQELVFEVALGQKAEEVKKFRVPLGHGFAGLVAVSGQPMTASDVESDSRHASDIAQLIGYSPKSILCCPLVYNDQVVGVLELLDRRGASSFSPADIDTLWMFANQAAIALEQSRTYRNLAQIIASALEATGRTSADRQDVLVDRARSFARDVEEGQVFRQALELADLVRQIAWQGEDEIALCGYILRGVADYVKGRSEPLSGLEWR